MKTWFTRSLRLGLAAALVLLGAACGGGGGGSDAPAAAGPTPTVQLTGTAATGAPIAGATVTATNAAGTTATATTGADGSFTLTIADGAPFVLKVADATGAAWYGYASAAGRANVTPLTTLALQQAAGGKPLAEVVAAWASSPIAADAALQAAKVVNANLQVLMQAKGVDPTQVNVFAATFAADRTGLDAVLDAMRVSIACSAGACTQTITGPAGQALIEWNGNIATTGITLSWSTTGTGGGSSSGSVTVGLGSCKAPVAGTYSVVVQTTVTGVSVPVPEVCIDGLPAQPASQAEFCAGDVAKQQLPPGVEIVSCSFAGDTGTIAARITTPIAIDYSVRYTFVKR